MKRIIVVLKLIAIVIASFEIVSADRKCYCKFGNTKKCCQNTGGNSAYGDDKCIYDSTHPGTGDQSDFANCCVDPYSSVQGFTCEDWPSDD